MARKIFNIKIVVIMLACFVVGAVALAGGLAAQDAAKNAKSADAPVAAANANAETAWAVRCNDVKEGEKVTGKYCEMVQNISVAKKDADPSTAQRLVEMAIGYPPAEKGKAAAVVILPLGILVNEDIVLELDGDKELDFDARYCDGGGCYSIFELSDKLITKFTKGKTITIKAMAATGQPIAIELSLAGFAAAHNEIKPKK